MWCCLNVFSFLTEFALFNTTIPSFSRAHLSVLKAHATPSSCISTFFQGACSDPIIRVCETLHSQSWTSFNCNLAVSKETDDLQHLICLSFFCPLLWRVNNSTVFLICADRAEKTPYSMATQRPNLARWDIVNLAIQSA